MKGEKATINVPIAIVLRSLKTYPRGVKIGIKKSSRKCWKASIEPNLADFPSVLIMYFGRENYS